MNNLPHDVTPYARRLEKIGARETQRRARRTLLRSVFISRDWALPDAQSERERAVEAAGLDPARYVDRATVREIGWELFAIGGLDLMRECCATLDDVGAISFVDSTWDGIGTPSRGFWWR